MYTLFRQQVKRGKVNIETVHRNIDTLMPEELQDETKRAVEVCKDVSVGVKDNCESSFLMLKCLYKENPKFYFPWRKFNEILLLTMDMEDKMNIAKHKII